MSAHFNTYAQPTVEDFNRATSRRLNRLHGSLREYVRTQPNDNVSRLSGAAGLLLLRGRALAKREIPDSVLAHSEAASHVRGIINNSVNHVAPDQTGAVPYFSRANVLAKNCGLAELGFSQMLAAMRGNIPKDADNWGGEILVDDNNVPFAIRKAAGYSSSLATRPVNIDGIVWPAGTIVNFTEPGETQDYELESIAGEAFTLRKRTAKLGGAGCRLSGLSVSPAQREQIYVPPTTTTYAFDVYQSLEPHEIQPLAEHVVQGLLSA